MRAPTTTRLALVGATALAVAGLVSCSSTVDGRGVCPGCGTASEPSFGTPAPSVSTPTTPTTPETPTAGPTATAAPGPGGEQTLPTDDSGLVYVETKSGKTRCQLSSDAVGCESEFENSPEIDGERANGVKVTAGGDLTWVVGNLGAIPAVTLDYQTYEAAGWTIAADPSGTRFTNDATGHGMFVATEGVDAF